MRTPPPPNIGDRFYGPSRSDRASKRGPFASIYHVRAVVDHIPADGERGHEYYVVLRRWSSRYGGSWSYTIEHAISFAVMGSGKKARALFMPAPTRRREG